MKTATRWYVASLLVFWGAVVTVILIDFASVKVLSLEGPSGPDLFPNQVLGIALIVAQIIAAGCLAIAAWKMAAASQSRGTAVLGIFLAVAIALMSFVAYLLLALWYQYDFMNRPT